jgi:proline racemase
VSARLAILHAKGELSLNEPIVVESILGAEAHFVGRVVGTGRVGPFASVTPEITGRAFVTGMHQFVADPRDSLAEGFLL